MSVLSSDPVRRRQELAARRIRGVGAAERADGHAYGRLTSAQRGEYGSQRNFRAAMDASAERRAVAEAEETGRQKAREDAEHQAEVWNRARGAAGGSMLPPIPPPTPTAEQSRADAEAAAARRREAQEASVKRAEAARRKYGQPPISNAGGPAPSATKPRQYKDWLAARRRAPLTFRA